MKMRIPIFTIAVIALGLSTGCATYFEEQQRTTMRQNTELLNQKTEVQQLRAQFDALERIVQDQASAVAPLREDGPKQIRESQETMAALDRRIKALEDARQTDKDAIIKELSEVISRLPQYQGRPAVSSPASGSAPAQQASAQGREHVVQAGETLSSIAAVYKVKVNAIVQANALKNADSVRVGQKLVIPE